jgi:Uncharacterized protein conserved in bacteria C-term(DUF2220)
MVQITFTPSPDVALSLHALLDTLEQRERRYSGPAGAAIHKSVRCDLVSLPLPGYHSQIDPLPRQIANEQLQTLEQSGWLKLSWLPGETGHLLAAVTLVPEHAASIFALLQRTPQAAQRARLIDLLLGERFRFADWRLDAIQRTLDNLKADKSSAPFSLTDDEFNRDLLIALAAFDNVHEETPYRVFSVRVFNDSKRFEALIGAVCTLARRHQAAWHDRSNEEVLRELNLTANPTHLYLHGPWRLIDEAGQVIALDGFEPSVGLAAAQAQHVHTVRVEADRLICVENQTTFYELIRHKNLTQVSEPSLASFAAICLWGNPSPACRQLLNCLPPETPLLVWADIDYGGLNILAQLREQVNRRAQPYRMDIETLEAYARWAQPLTSGDIRHLNRLLRRAALSDMRPLIEHMLQRGLKLEQEAIALS